MSGNKEGYSTTSQKHSNFVSEPMGYRSVRQVPGIGPVLGGRLEDMGITRAEQLLGQYLLSGRDQGQFQDYLRNTIGANNMQQRDAYNGMREWTNNNM